MASENRSPAGSDPADIPSEVLTAVGAAWVRAHHYVNDARPLICEDRLAPRMIADDEYAFWRERWIAHLLDVEADGGNLRDRSEAELEADAMRKILPPVEVLTRQRFCEDALASAVRQGLDQYVIFGAGMDTYALRNPDSAVRVYELDRAVSQRFKRRRIAEAGLAEPPNVRYVTVDFEGERVDDVLRGAGFDPNRPSFFGWFGVTMYLSVSAFHGTLRAIRRIAAPGSHLAFDYLAQDGFDPQCGTGSFRALIERLEAAGNRVPRDFQPETMGDELADFGFTLAEHPGPADIDARYLAGRADGYTAADFCHFARAEVDRPAP